MFTARHMLDVMSNLTGFTKLNSDLDGFMCLFSVIQNFAKFRFYFSVFGNNRNIKFGSV